MDDCDETIGHLQLRRMTDVVELLEIDAGMAAGDGPGGHHVHETVVLPVYQEDRELIGDLGEVVAEAPAEIEEHRARGIDVRHVRQVGR